MWRWVVELVVCPVCRRRLAALDAAADDRDAVLGHVDGTCPEVYPVIGGIPRLLVGEARALLAAERADWFRQSPLASRFRSWVTAAAGAEVRAADLRVVARFDREWRAFPRVGTAEQELVFARYFDVVPAELLAADRVALDAGCGGGRWAYQVQRHGPRVVAVDLGRSIEVAERNTRDTGRVACVQADVRDLPLKPASFDLAYSLGVLHHVGPTERAVRGLAELVRPGGSLLLYLYYALDSRSTVYRSVFRVADAVRRASSRLPQPLLVVVSTAIAVTVYWPLARLARVLGAIGLRRAAEALPLSFYADLSLRTMRNDSQDRFGTSVEKRYARAEVRRLLEDAGLSDVRVSDASPYWHAAGMRPLRERPTMTP
ncbi:MAG TPA: class I SAM-dependent methyltransferase [Candidatus Limnocylindria bacterium]|nr:class I SAM-dependent methyltransferase [Candidatus Limnocylindria bacterium]